MTEFNDETMIQAIRSGIRKAQRIYHKAYESDLASGNAPEYLMNVYIFEALYTIKKMYGVGLEVSVNEILKTFKEVALKSRLNQGRTAGKSDIVFWDSSKPRCVIEVKKNPWMYSDDIERLALLVESGLDTAFFASCYYISVNEHNENPTKALLEEVGCIKRHIDEHLEYYRHKFKIKTKLIVCEVGGRATPLCFKEEQPENQKWVWRPVIFKLSRV